MPRGPSEPAGYERHHHQNEGQRQRQAEHMPHMMAGHALPGAVMIERGVMVVGVVMTLGMSCAHRRLLTSYVPAESPFRREDR